MQRPYCRDLRRVFLGTAPTLAVLSGAYGRQVAESWLSIQLRDLSEFSGCKDKLTIRQTDELSGIIARDFAHFKVTELMYFFQLFKRGEYGKFYGAVDGLAITEALHAFSRGRMEARHRYRQAAEQAEREAEEEQHRRDLAAFHALLDRYGLTIPQWLANRDLFDGTKSENEIKAELAHRKATGKETPADAGKSPQRG